jgi:hypothetical protein
MAQTTSDCPSHVAGGEYFGDIGLFFRSFDIAPVIKSTPSSFTAPCTKSHSNNARSQEFPVQTFYFYKSRRLIIFCEFPFQVYNFERFQ